MKRYVIFAAVAPLLGGFWLLLTTTIMSGYWSHPNAADVAKLFKIFGMTLQFSYLFGLLPALMIGAVDDILYHFKRIGPIVRMLVVAVIAFIAMGLLQGSQGSDTGAFQFVMYGLAGFIPGAVSSWLVHKFVGEQQPVATQSA